jgi:hypothetical protein
MMMFAAITANSVQKRMGSLITSLCPYSSSTQAPAVCDGMVNFELSPLVPPKRPSIFVGPRGFGGVVPLLSLYCTSIHLARFYATAIGEEGDDGRNHKNWCENARLAASLATRLRLTPSSRYDARQADRYSAAIAEEHRDRGIKLADEQRVMGRSPVQGGRYGASPRFRLGEP